MQSARKQHEAGQKADWDMSSNRAGIFRILAIVSRELFEVNAFYALISTSVTTGNRTNYVVRPAVEWPKRYSPSTCATVARTHRFAS
jgi:hypothetical protein